MPKALEEKPRIPWYLGDYFKAFLQLNRRRQYNMAQQPLLMTEIETYCRNFGFECDSDFFFYLMFELDAEYMKFLSEKRKQEQEENDRVNKSKGWRGMFSRK